MFRFPRTLKMTDFAKTFVAVATTISFTVTTATPLAAAVTAAASLSGGVAKPFRAPKAKPILEILDSAGKVVDPMGRASRPVPAAPRRVAIAERSSQRPAQKKTPEQIEEIKKNLASTKILKRRSTDPIPGLMALIGQSSTRQELHELIGLLPVSRTFEVATDGRVGTYTYFKVAGVARARMFYPAVTVEHPESLAGNEMGESGPSDLAETWASGSSTRDDVCYFEEVEGDCPTQQELDDVAALIATAEAEEAQAESDLAALDQEYADYCNEYNCDSEPAISAMEGEADDSEGASEATDWCPLAAGCGWAAADAAAGIAAHAVGRIGLGMALNSHVASIAATGVGLSVFGWAVAIAGAALGTYALVRGIIVYAECVNSSPRL